MEPFVPFCGSSALIRDKCCSICIKSESIQKNICSKTKGATDEPLKSLKSPEEFITGTKETESQEVQVSPHSPPQCRARKCTGMGASLAAPLNRVARVPAMRTMQSDRKPHIELWIYFSFINVVNAGARSALESGVPRSIRGNKYQMIDMITQKYL